MKNIDNYRNSIGKLFLDENSRTPFGVLDDFVINYKDLKIEGFILKDSFFRDSKVLKSISRWGENLFISEKSIKDLGFYEKVKKLLIEGNSIIWKKVVSETGENLGNVYNFIFSTSSFIGISIVIRKSFFGLFFYGKERIIPKNEILEINKDVIIVNNQKLVKA